MNQGIEKYDLLLNQRDDSETELKFDSVTHQITLIVGKDFPRKIGKIIPLENNQFAYYKLEDESQIHRKTKSWSVNRFILNRVDKVIYETDLIRYSISKEKALEVGMTFEWDPPNIDKKIFIPIEFWDKEYKSKKVNAIIDLLGYEWYTELKDEFSEPYMKRLSKFLVKERASKVIYPRQHEVFNAYKLTGFSKIKVVIVGREPYPNENAHGLAFSSLDELKMPLSLQTIYKEIEDDVYGGVLLNQSIDLSHWAKQGVLLLNSVLTTEAGKPNAHAKIGWELFIGETLKHINNSLKNVVFMFWGDEAKSFIPHINPDKHLILTAPLPDSFDSGFLGCGHFSKANEYLKKHRSRRDEIEW